MGWRRVTWPAALWIEILPVAAGSFAWTIWSHDRKTVLARGAEPYTRYADAARGARVFIRTQVVALDAAVKAAEGAWVTK